MLPMADEASGVDRYQEGAELERIKIFQAYIRLGIPLSCTSAFCKKQLSGWELH